MTGRLIEVRALTVRSGGRCLLDIPHLDVATGRVVAVLGPNGAGKTTLARACLGVVPPASGTLIVLGQEVAGLRAGALARLRRRIGYVPQLPPARSELPLTVREVVVMGRTGRAGLFRPLGAADWRSVDEWLERLGLTPLRDRAFSEISGGEQRKALLARAMVQEPELLVLDEPTAHLDLGWRERLVATMATLHADTGVSVLLICHELEVLPPGCREVVLLDAGRVLAQGTPEEVFTTARVAQLYGAGLRVWHQEGRHAVLPEGNARA